MRLDPAEARALFAAAPVARLATVRPDGSPHIVPVCFAFSGETIYTAVDHKPKATAALARLRHIAAEPRVALLADRYEDDWSRLWWVRVDGDASIADSPQEREAASAALAGAYPQYAARPPQGPVIAVRPRRFSGWRA
ncbi:MAG TPA: TIGR03668 family PPOX class F420-dependent oxidoreductase [Gaiellales bacterium]|nr:TIGR03668 family PPOX class F420-dependent oxidoreductase [Gaiellales bacterium]